MEPYLERDRVEGGISIVRLGTGLCIFVEVPLLGIIVCLVYTARFW